MKYIFQFARIAGICFLAEMLYKIIPLPVPASVYGLLILLFLLLTKIIRLDQIEDVADYLISIMPVLFISPSVSLITSLDILKGNILAIILIGVCSTVTVVLVTGKVAQIVIRFQNHKKDKGEQDS